MRVVERCYISVIERCYISVIDRCYIQPPYCNHVM